MRQYSYADLMNTTFGLAPAGRQASTYRFLEVCKQQRSLSELAGTKTSPWVASFHVSYGPGLCFSHPCAPVLCSWRWPASERRGNSRGGGGQLEETL